MSLQWPIDHLEMVTLATLSILFLYVGIAWVGALWCNICISHCVECHMPTSVSSADGHQSLWPLWYCLAYFFVPSAPPPRTSNLAHTYSWLWLLLISHQSWHHHLTCLWTALLTFFQGLCTCTPLLLFTACLSIPGQTHCFFYAVLIL